VFGWVVVFHFCYKDSIMARFGTFAKEASKQGIETYKRVSEPDGIHAITNLKFDKEVQSKKKDADGNFVLDKNGKVVMEDSVLVSTANGQIRLYRNSHDIVIDILAGLAKGDDDIEIAYYHEKREPLPGQAKSNGSWLHARVGVAGDPELKAHMARKGQSRVSTQSSTGGASRDSLRQENPAPQQEVPVSVDEDEEMPF
jgi:hypothetical protein